MCRCVINSEQTTWWLPSVGQQCLQVEAQAVVINETTNNVSIFFYHIDFIFVLNFEINIIYGTSNYTVINLKKNMEKQLYSKYANINMEKRSWVRSRIYYFWTVSGSYFKLTLNPIPFTSFIMLIQVFLTVKLKSSE